MANPAIRMPERAKRGEVIEIRTIVPHPMETGYRVNNVGKPIARHIIETFTCTYNEQEVFRARFFPAIAANPYLAFYTVAVASGELVFTWKDDWGEMQTETRRIEVE